MTTFAAKKVARIKRDAKGPNSQRTKRRCKRTPEVPLSFGEMVRAEGLLTAAERLDDNVDAENEDCGALAPEAHKDDGYHIRLHYAYFEELDSASLRH